MKFHKIENSIESLYLFHCPGCGYGHHVRFKGKEPCWQVNGVEEDKPTVFPSILVMGDKRCHSFIKDGKIQFLSDSYHKLTGTTVELPDFDTFD